LFAQSKFTQFLTNQPCITIGLASASRTASPKLMSFMGAEFSLLASRMQCGLRLRWTMLLLWQYRTASATCRM